MTPTTARDSKKKCNGFKGCGGVIFSSTQYYKLRGKKCLCKKCVDAINEQEDSKELSMAIEEWIES